MPRLTVPPNLIGTSGIDTLVAEDFNPLAIGIDVLSPGVINTLSGNDSITGTGTVGSPYKLIKPSTGIGINISGTLNAGDGSDMIVGIGTGGSGIKITGEDGTGNNDSSSLNAGTKSNTNAADSSTGDIRSSRNGTSGIGIRNSGNLKAGNGNDIITGTGTGGATRGGGGGSAAPDRQGVTGIGISNSYRFDAGKGNDTITGTGTGGTGAPGGFQGGDDSKGGDGGAGIGISNSGSFDAGDGNDTIKGIGTSGNGSEGMIFAITQSIPPSIFRGESGDGGTGIGIQNIKNATIITGLGKDTIKGFGDSLGLKATVYGIFNDGIIDTGDDHDILTGQSITTLGGTAYGIYGKGTINTGNGNDKVTATSSINKVEQKVSIGGGIHLSLGAGDDYFKGFGGAIVDGGKGFDTLDLSSFKRSGVTVSGVAFSNPNEVVNITFKDNGNSITLLTTGFEKFIFADSSLDYSNLI
ncbi:MAG: hypothetical protein KME50_39135 [Nostoc desertorum CM1-VF14]|jgi:hypothetical protein|nr:hypothetical protein [Nostoc desertorum CM1-VF14]